MTHYEVWPADSFRAVPLLEKTEVLCDALILVPAKDKEPADDDYTTFDLVACWRGEIVGRTNSSLQHHDVLMGREVSWWSIDILIPSGLLRVFGFEAWLETGRQGLMLRPAAFDEKGEPTRTGRRIGGWAESLIDAFFRGLKKMRP